MESKEQTPAVDDDTPMTLDQACTEIFRGMIKPATLRAESARGRLVIERIGRRDFVTRSGVKEMRRLCQGPRAAPPSSQIRPGIAEGTRAEAALAAALRSAKELRKPKTGKVCR